jgi:hypothetical protein
VSEARMAQRTLGESAPGLPRAAHRTLRRIDPRGSFERANQGKTLP